MWEEPLLPSRLLVRVGPDALRGGDLHRGDGGSAPSVAAAHLQAWGVGRVSSEETGTMSGQIKLIRYMTGSLERRRRGKSGVGTRAWMLGVVVTPSAYEASHWRSSTPHTKNWLRDFC